MSRPRDKNSGSTSSDSLDVNPDRGPSHWARTRTMIKGKSLAKRGTSNAFAQLASTRDNSKSSATSTTFSTSPPQGHGRTRRSSSLQMMAGELDKILAPTAASFSSGSFNADLGSRFGGTTRGQPGAALQFASLVNTVESPTGRLLSPIADDHSNKNKCYRPRPVPLAEYYNDPNWRPVAISERTVRVPGKKEDTLCCHEQDAFFHNAMVKEEIVAIFKRHGAERGLTLVLESPSVPSHYVISVWNGVRPVNFAVEFHRRNSLGVFVLGGRTRHRSLAHALLYLAEGPQQKQGGAQVTPLSYIPRIPEGVRCRITRMLFVGSIS